MQPAYNCFFAADADDPRVKRCIRTGCGARVVTNDPPERCWSTCQAAAFNCAHLGTELRQAECPTCGGAVRLAVFECAKYGEATIDRRAPDVAGCCRGCAMFEAGGTA